MAEGGDSEVKTDKGSVSDGEVLVEKAKKYYSQHQFEEAISEYKKALEADPDNQETYGLIGYSYYRDQQIPKTIDAFQMSLKLNPKEAMSYYNLALAYWANDQRNESVSQLKSLFLLDPKYEDLVGKDDQFKDILKSPYFKNTTEE